MCTLKPPFDAKDMKGLYDKIKTGKYTPISTKYSKELQTLVSKMIQVNPINRPSAEEILRTWIPSKDFTKTMVKSNSQPGLLNTIKVPRNLVELKKILPSKKYKNPVVNENKMPQISRDISVNQLQDDRLNRQPSVVVKNPSRPESK